MKKHRVTVTGMVAIDVEIEAGSEAEAFEKGQKWAESHFSNQTMPIGDVPERHWPFRIFEITDFTVGRTFPEIDDIENDPDYMIDPIHQDTLDEMGKIKTRLLEAICHLSETDRHFIQQNVTRVCELSTGLVCCNIKANEA